MRLPKPRDPLLKLPAASYYWVCFPLRVMLGLALIISARWTVEDATWFVYAAAGVVSAVVLGLMYKGYALRATPVWKNYVRAVTGLAAGASVLFVGAVLRDTSLIIAGGLIILFDALMGQQSRHMGIFR